MTYLQIQEKSWFKLTIPFVLTALAAGLRVWPLHMLGTQLTWLTFNPVLAISALLGGGLSCILTALLSVLLVLCWSPTGVPFIQTPQDWIGVVVFCITGSLIAFLGERNLKSQKKALEGKKAAEQALQSKSLFISNMSHEIRTPMNAILGFSQLLSERVEDPHSQNYLNIIQSSGKALLMLINDILDISKIEAGKLELHLEPMSLFALCLELEQFFLPDFEKHHLALRFELDPSLPDWIEMDNLRLRQILVNLINNALKFTPEGQVTVRLNHLSETQELKLEVSDTGIGIPPEFQSLIFETFEQVNPSHFKAATGTGLGLAITRQLVNLMGGQIRLTSQEHQGSVFQILLPLRKAQPLNQAALESPFFSPYAFAPAVLLIADDVETNRLLLKEMLRPYPFTLYMANDGREACELAEQYHPDLILMDIKMPIMDGTEALQWLQQNPATETLPVVALTAFSLQNEQKDLLEMGFEGYLSKPVQRDLLLQMLRRLLARPSENEAPSLESALAEKNRPPIADSLSLPLTNTDIAERSQAIATHWLPQAESLRQNMVINEMEDFALALAPWAKKWQWPTLLHLCQALQEQLAAFELEAAQHSLAQISETLQTQPPGEAP